MTGPSSVQVSVNGVLQDKPWDQACPVCASPLMVLIDALLAGGWAYRRVSEHLIAIRADRARELTPGALRAHVPHLVPAQAQERRMLDLAAEGRGGEDVDSLVTTRELVRLSLQRAYQRVADGAEVNLRDIQGLLKLQREMDRDAAADGGAADAAKWQGAMKEVLWILRRHLRGPAWKAFVADMRNSETLRALMPPDDERAADGGDDSARA
jgi:hypothetical protein